ncbi:MAG: hypothetical protein ACM3SQ_13950 [Betaproteobacteria bacterium]
MQWLWAALTAAMMTITGVGAQITSDTRAADLLKQARAALGGEAALAAVKGLTCSGTFRRDAGGRDLSGDIKIDLAIPDRYLQTESMNPVGDATIVVERGVNGDTLLSRSRTLGGAPGMMLRIATPDTPDARAQAVRAAKADLTRLTMALLMTSPAMPLEMSYAGEADAPDGSKADALDAKGAGSFAAQLFLDRTSHRPLMLAYRGIGPRVVMRTTRQPPAGAPSPETQHEALPPPRVVDINWYFDDYRQVDGIWLPYHVSKSIEGKPAEEWTFTSVKVNPTFDANTFSAK